MNYLFSLPMLVALFLVIRRRADLALLWVYLPCLLFLPTFYSFHIPHLPNLSAAEGILLPLGAAAFVYWLRGPFKRMDLWVFLYMVSIWLTELLREPDRTNGVIFAIISVDTMLFSYLVGRKLIEPELRIRVMKYIIVIVLCQFPFLVWEGRMSANLYRTIGHLFGWYSFWVIQLRGGHARISGAFSDAELAGIAFAVCIVLNVWLIWINRTDLKNHQIPRLGPLFSKLQKYWIPGWILVVFLAFTQSRGPELGLAAGLLVLQVTRFPKRKKLALAAATIVVLLGAAATYAFFSNYASAPSKSEEQQSAAYRLKLSQNYKPIIEQGGWLGWGGLIHPNSPGQRSVDNEYLLVHLAFGRLGLICFYLIVAESVWHQARCVLRFRQKEDFQFAVTMLAALLVIWLTVATVFLGEQLPQITFLLIGWGQSLTERREDAALALEEPALAIGEERQYTRVFS